MSERIQSAINSLVEILGKDRVRSDRTTLISYARDVFMPGYLDLRRGKIEHLPWLVCYPENIEQVSKIVKIARENKIPLIAFGGGSGVLGGTTPLKGGVIVDLKRMRKIHSINKINQTCVADAGIFGEELERALNREGFTLGHFPSSIYCSTLGGWLATRSAGQFSAKYGKIEDLVIALVGVLADGSIFHTKATPRSATGPDLDQVLIGSEGTLGIITSAILSISPVPSIRSYRGFSFEGVEMGLEAIRVLMQKEREPALLRLYDPMDTKFNASKLKAPSSGCLLVIGYEGFNKERTELKARLGFEELKNIYGKDLGEAPGLAWLEHRYSVSYNQSKILSQAGNLLDTIEVSVRFRDALGLYQRIMERIGKIGLVMAHFSHAWRDGVCIYFSFLVNDPEPEKLREKHFQVWKKAMSACLELGASISHHHGIGFYRSRWLKQELGLGHQILVKLKKELDPDFIFNPGKLGLGED